MCMMRYVLIVTLHAMDYSVHAYTDLGIVNQVLLDSACHNVYVSE